MKQQEKQVRTVFNMQYGILEARTNSVKMYMILRQLGWKIKLSELGRLI